jgi:hypothetical protein
VEKIFANYLIFRYMYFNRRGYEYKMVGFGVVGGRGDGMPRGATEYGTYGAV